MSKRSVDAHLGYEPYTGPVPPVSVVILTFNEEVNIAECLRSCAWSDDVHVLDSGSTDGTCRIAREMGATVHTHPFSSFGEQRNWAIDHIVCRHPWHFHLDADERFTAEMVREIHQQIGSQGTATANSAYRVPSKMIFLDRWLKRSGGYPAYQVRLFKHGECRFVDFGHGQREDTTGTIGTLKHPYIHYGFSKGLVEWFGKHNEYSCREALGAVVVRAKGLPRWRHLRSLDPTVRRRAVKDLSFFLWGRALWRFLYQYFVRGGFLDGMVGFHYCAMISMYEYWTELKICEHEAQWNQRTWQHATRLMQERHS